MFAFLSPSLYMSQSFHLICDTGAPRVAFLRLLTRFHCLKLPMKFIATLALLLHCNAQSTDDLGPPLDTSTNSTVIAPPSGEGLDMNEEIIAPILGDTGVGSTVTSSTTISTSTVDSNVISVTTTSPSITTQSSSLNNQLQRQPQKPQTQILKP